MQLYHLDDSVYRFVNTHFQPALGFQCFTIFTLAEQLGLKHYGESFVDLVAIDEDVDMDEVRDSFWFKVNRLVTEMIESHYVFIDPDSQATLDELIEVCHFLVLCQNLEDTSVLEARIYDTYSSSRKIFVDVLCQLSHLQVWRGLEIIAKVDDRLIQAMQYMCKDRQEESPNSADQNYAVNLQMFAQFTKGAPSLGMQLLENGYRKLMWETVEALSLVDLSKHFETTANTSVAQAALDIVSLAMLCTDTYQTPLIAVQKKLGLYLEDRDMVTKVHAAASHILTDYLCAKQAAVQAAAANKDNEHGQD